MFSSEHLNVLIPCTLLLTIALRETYSKIYSCDCATCNHFELYRPSNIEIFFTIYGLLTLPVCSLIIKGYKFSENIK